MKTIVFETLWTKSYDGWAIAARAYARALLYAGYDVRLKSYSPGPELEPEVAAEIPEQMRTPVKQWDAYIFSTPFGGPKAMNRAQTFPLLERTIKRPRLFYTMFERCHVQPDLTKIMNEVLDAVWVPCQSNRAALERAGSQNTTWIPLPYFPDNPYLALPPPRERPRTFLWVGRWEPRKRPDALIQAFMQAFKPGEAKLVLKLGPSPWVQSPYPTPENAIHASLGRTAPEDWSSSIEIIRETLSAEQMLLLHARADVYVSPSRGEGIDLPAYMAKLAGRRLIVTESGGPLDFVGEGDIIVPATGEVSAEEYSWIWDEGATLIDYDVDDLVLALQYAASAPPVKRDPLSMFKVDAVAKRFKRWLEGVM